MTKEQKRTLPSIFKLKPTLLQAQVAHCEACQSFFYLLSTAVSIVVYNSQSNSQISGAMVSVDGANYTAPANLGTFAAGTMLLVTVYASGFISESRNVTISNPAGNFRQQVTFNLSPVLVMLLFYQ